MGDGWERLESMVHAAGLDEGLAARIADPLWMLARQAQVGEFTGDDAAQPAAVRVVSRTTRLAGYRPGPAPAAPPPVGLPGPVPPGVPPRGDQPGAVQPAIPLPRHRPLESVVEAMPGPTFGTAGLHADAVATRALWRLLRERSLAEAIPLLRGGFPHPGAGTPVDAGPAAEPAADLLTRWSVDVARLAGAPAAELAAALADLPATDRAAVATAVADWRTTTAPPSNAAGTADPRDPRDLRDLRDPRDPGDPGNPAWSGERMEYAFSLAAPTGSGEVVLAAPEHDGGHLDWYSVDITRDRRAGHGLAPAPPTRRTTVAVPTPIRYPGMPAGRWWEFEDGTVHFGDVEAGPADLARLLVAEFATVYADDHFVVPLPVPAGSLTEIESVEVFDTFGGRTGVPATARIDARRFGPDRAWRMFELAGDEPGDGHPSPWLFAPPGVDALPGPALERVMLVRDEDANLAWGIEHLIEGPLGRAVRRADAWPHPGRPAASARPAAPGTEAAAGPGTGGVDGAGAEPAWRYRLEATAPPWWVPFVAERVAAESAQVRLRRARMSGWTDLADQPAGPRGSLLDPRRPVWLLEEEVPAGGVEVERAWQLARWYDGSVHTWLRWRKRPGRGDRSSGVRWDLLDQT